MQQHQETHYVQPAKGHTQKQQNAKQANAQKTNVQQVSDNAQRVRFDQQANAQGKVVDGAH